MRKKLVKKLQELLAQGYEQVTIWQVLKWIRDFTPPPSQSEIKKYLKEEK